MPGDVIAVHFVDLDGFKAVNDRLGHDAGDQCLRIVAQRLASMTREQDLVARLGGDEFVVVETAAPGPESALGLANKIIRTLSEPVPLDDCEVTIGASVGIAFGTAADDIELLLRAADRALYRSGDFDLAAGP